MPKMPSQMEIAFDVMRRPAIGLARHGHLVFSERVLPNPAFERTRGSVPSSAITLGARAAQRER